MKLGVFGAGAIGGFVGGRLQLAGHSVVFVGRRGGALASEGLTLTDYTGARWRIPPEQLMYTTDAAALAPCDAVLVTVKSAATAEAGAALARVLRPGATVVSFQNGVSNVQVLRAALGGHRVVAGMVPFNVLWRGDAHLHNGTSGPLELERTGAEALASALKQAVFDVVLHDDLQRVQWTKLLINANNAVNALAGIPLRDQLSDRAYRRVMARVIQEGLSCLRAAGIKPVRIGKLIPSVAPRVLSLPNWLFLRVAAAMVKVDPDARSSMWEDLERRRATEVDYLNGELIKLSDKHGVPTPMNRRLVELIRAAETAGRGSPRLSAAQLLS